MRKKELLDKINALDGRLFRTSQEVCELRRRVAELEARPVYYQPYTPSTPTITFTDGARIRTTGTGA